jgi:putative ABC transport system permease protein
VGNVRTIQQQVDFPQIFVSYLQQAEPNMSLMIRRRPGTAPPIEPVKAAIWSVEPRQAVFDIRSFEDAVAQSVQGYRTIAVLIGSFATLAFVMSVTGIFTVVSYATTRRVREIAVRRAIGAQPADIIRLLAGQTLRWATGGLIVGGAIAVFAASALRATVPALVALDARLVGAVGITYLVVVALAMAWPAARALRIDPATALRAE